MTDERDKTVTDETPRDAASVARAYEAQIDGDDEGVSEILSEPGDLSDAPGKAAALDAELQAARKEAADKGERLVRTLADFDNFRKRAEREKSELAKYGNERLIRELLVVMDNFERALKHAEKDDTVASLRSGIKLVYDQMLGILTGYGLRPVETVGLQFDPNKHESIAHAETVEFEPGTVVEEMQKGYYLADRLLRPAMVSVAKHPAKGEGN